MHARTHARTHNQPTNQPTNADDKAARARFGGFGQGASAARVNAWLRTSNTGGSIYMEICRSVHPRRMCTTTAHTVNPREPSLQAYSHSNLQSAPGWRRQVALGAVVGVVLGGLFVLDARQRGRLGLYMGKNMLAGAQAGVRARASRFVLYTAAPPMHTRARACTPPQPFVIEH